VGKLNTGQACRTWRGRLFGRGFDSRRLHQIELTKALIWRE